MVGGSSVVHMVARTSEVMWTWSRGKVAADDRSLPAGFGDLATKSPGGRFLGLGLKTKAEDSTRRRGFTGRSNRLARVV